MAGGNAALAMRHAGEFERHFNRGEGAEDHRSRHDPVVSKGQPQGVHGGASSTWRALPRLREQIGVPSRAFPTGARGEPSIAGGPGSRMAM